MSYTRIATPPTLPTAVVDPSDPSLTIARSAGGGGRIRTYVDIRRQIYSLLPLTARPPLRIACRPAQRNAGHKIRLGFVNPGVDGPTLVRYAAACYRAAATDRRAPTSRQSTSASRSGRTRRRRATPRRQSALAASEPRRTRAGGSWIYGRHAVAAALANPERRWHRLAVLAGQEEEAQPLWSPARRAARRGDGERDTRARPQRLCGAPARGRGASGAGARRSSRSPSPTSTTCCARAEAIAGASIIVVLDQVSDPHNVGAVLRSAAAFGALAVIVPEHGAPPPTGALAKAASGALDSVPLVRVVNLARALDRLKEAGFWICGLDETAPAPLAGARSRRARRAGARLRGRRHAPPGARALRLSRAAADPPRQSTLNVSNAAAVALYELVRDWRRDAVQVASTSGSAMR